MPLAPLASEAVLDRYLSEHGVSTWADHDQDGINDTGVVSDCQTYATGLLAGRLANRYTYSQIMSAPMMVEVYAIIVLRELTLRRGNAPPASLEARYQEIMQRDGLLDQISSGKFHLTDENGDVVRMKNANTPKHSNLQIDRRFSEKRVRVVTGSSNMEQSKLRRDFDRHYDNEVL